MVFAYGLLLFGLAVLGVWDWLARFSGVDLVLVNCRMVVCLVMFCCLMV